MGERLRHGAARTLDTRNLPIESQTTNADAMPPTSMIEHTIGGPLWPITSAI